jgi:2-keto-4-pentenoate hydratase
MVHLDEIVESFWQNRQRGVYYPPEWHGKLTLDEAYRVNLAIVNRQLELGEQQAGWKVGVTAKAMQLQQGVHEPVFGVLFASGHRDSGTVFAFDELIQPAFENELCLTIGETLRGPNLNAQDARRALAAVAPALEIVERRGEFRDLPLAMADNAQQKAFVTGAAVRYDLQGTELAESYVDVYVNGDFKERASGSEVMGDPAASVAWLANKLAQFGLALEAGMRVMSGSFTRQYALNSGDHVEARFTPFGTVTAKFGL